MSVIEPSPSTGWTPIPALLREHFAATVRLAWLLTGDSHAAEDVAQDAFVKLYRYAETSPRPIVNPAALLRTTTGEPVSNVAYPTAAARARMTRHGPDATSLTEWERELDDQPASSAP